eukprot:CAMPEP_0184728220 /NCGR_PEP_ID=MMETSP0314-20130426/39295_1 /TAXON_ID=38298 /ORGANISM="Rhodella maculata, Strain CCMP 736" /LENGTH=58 /DNA_ID=CAMNT_0027194017 /DNA_START=54 /DNA_END=230 /DNA_ORIENTATION=-
MWKFALEEAKGSVDLALNVRGTRSVIADARDLRKNFPTEFGGIGAHDLWLCKGKFWML